MLRTIISASVAAICFSTGASAYIGQQSAALNGISLNGMQLQGITLQGMSLQGVKMQGIQLQGMNLQGVNMQGTNLQGVEMKVHAPIGRAAGTAPASLIVEEVILPTGEAVSLR